MMKLKNDEKNYKCNNFYLFNVCPTESASNFHFAKHLL
jgi:hypothetical protein